MVRQKLLQAAAKRSVIHCISISDYFFFFRWWDNTVTCAWTGFKWGRVVHRQPLSSRLYMIQWRDMIKTTWIVTGMKWMTMGLFWVLPCSIRFTARCWQSPLSFRQPVAFPHIHANQVFTCLCNTPQTATFCKRRAPDLNALPRHANIVNLLSSLNRELPIISSIDVTTASLIAS